jgi:ubiquinone/menaquinone biosynthesis C-methylase UbiE
MLAMASTWRMPTGSLDRWPADYERGRPGWPREVIDVASVPSTATALDVGKGTGKLTRLLGTAVAHVFAVEPAAAMRRELRARCQTADVRNGTGQQLPLADASVDAARQ